MYTVISSIISALSAIFVCMLSQSGMAKKQAVQIDKQTALIELKLTQLTEDVRKHNNVIERTYALEEKCTLFAEKISAVNHRIDNLEKNMEKIS